MRLSAMSLPIFSGEDLPKLILVMIPPDRQLNLVRRLSRPTRLLVKPLALRLVRLFESIKKWL
jgi:hypothetical protein